MTMMTTAWDRAKESRLSDPDIALGALTAAWRALQDGDQWPDQFWLEYILMVGANSAGAAVLNLGLTSECEPYAGDLYRAVEDLGWERGGPTGYFDQSEADGLRRATSAITQGPTTDGVVLHQGSEAARIFESTLEAPLDPGRASALALLVDTVPGIAVVSVFRRYRDTGQPPDGGRSQATPVLAAAAPEGVHWATVPATTGALHRRLGEPQTGFEPYASYDTVTFHMGEVLFEGANESISFGTEYDVPTTPGDYMRALVFSIACAQLGYRGPAKTTDAFAPSAEDVAEARQWLRLASPQ